MFGNFGKLLAPQEDAALDYGRDVEALLQRISDSVLLSDRRDALFQLRDLLVDNAKAQLAFGNRGFPTLCAVLREYRTEVDMVRASLEAMSNATSQDGRSNQQEAQVGAVNAEQLARTPESVTVLLSLLDDEVGVQDFYARYHTLQILKALFAANSKYLQEAVLGFPLGVVRLIGMLEEQEAIRNEAVLLLQHLAEGNSEIQKLLVFEGAFDKLFAIIREEGGMDGGIVVHDCMLLLSVLLRNSVPNQLMFRELGYASEIPKLLQMNMPAAPTAPEMRESMTEDKQHNFLAVLKLVEVMVTAGGEGQIPQNNTARDQNVSVFIQHGLFQPLMTLALNQDIMPTSSVRAQALTCLASLAYNQKHKDMLHSAVASTHINQSLPLIHAVVRVVVNCQDSNEQHAADTLLGSMCQGNAALQYALANSLIPGGANSVGDEVLQGLDKQGSAMDMLTSSRAAAALSHIVSNNLELKQKLLSMRLPNQPAGVMAMCAQRLAAAVTKYGAMQEAPQMIVNFASLLLLWLHNFPPGAEAFLDSVRQTPFLVGAILSDKQFGKGSLTIRGTCALLLGICTKYVPAGASTSREALANAISSQIGVNNFVELLYKYQQQYDTVQQLSTAQTVIAYSFRRALPSLVGEIAADWGGAVQQQRQPQQPVSNGLPSSPPAYVSAVPAQPDFTPQQTTSTAVASPRLLNPQFSSPTAKSPISKPHVDPFMASQAGYLPSSIPVTGAASMPNSQPQFSTQPDTQGAYDASETHLLKEEVGRLQEELAELKKELAAARVEATNARNTASKFESELEGLSTAYAELDAHANQLQESLNAATSSHGNGNQSARGGITEEEVQKRILNAVEEVQQDSDAAMEDLLTCLGQEEAKVAALSERLEEAGISPQTVLDHLFDNSDEVVGRPPLIL